jgi:hypothetical protein
MASYERDRARTAPWVVIAQRGRPLRLHTTAAGTAPWPAGTEGPKRLDRDGRLARGVPVTEAEIEVFEAWFGDLFDELFSTRH